VDVALYSMNFAFSPMLIGHRLITMGSFCSLSINVIIATLVSRT